MSSRSTRRHRVVAKSEAKKWHANWRTYAIAGVVVLMVGGLGFLLYLSIKDPEALDGLKRFVGLSRGHDEEIEYAQLDLPPAGGLHSGIWQNCGIYDEPFETKNGVHSMEHGAVWISYQPELSSAGVARLQDAVRGERYVLLSPFPGLKSPVVLTAWGIQLELDSADDGRIANFIDQYQQGPQTPEPGATCQDGIGTPIG